MAFIPEDYLQATINFQGTNLPNGGAVVFGCNNAAAHTPATAAADIFADFGPVVTACCSIDVAMVSVDVKFGPPETGGMATFTGVAVPGAVGSTSLSPGSALLFEKATATGGRRGRGRMYLPGVYDGWVDDNGLMVAGTAATANAAMETMLDALEIDNLPMVLLHSPSYTWELVNGQPRRIYGSTASLPIPYPVLTITADPRIATQRRRLR